MLLTTHYLDEAQALADRVAIIKDGAILADGAPGDLGVGARATASPGATPTATPHERETEDPTPLLHELTAAALARGERLRRPQRHAAERWRTSTSSSPPEAAAA